MPNHPSPSIDATTFLQTKFLDFPSPILATICSFLPSLTVSIILIKSPQLREFIIAEFFSKKIVLDLYWDAIKASDEPWKFLLFKGPQKDFKSFFDHNPDLVPRLFEVRTGENSCDNVLKSLKKHLSKADGLEFFPSGTLSEATLNLVKSFPNLRSLTLDKQCIKAHRQMLPGYLAQISGLQSLRCFLENEADAFDVSGVSQLTSFTVSGILDSFSAAPTGNLSTILESFFPPLNSQSSTKYSYPQSLTSLDVGGLYIKKVNVSNLPPTLVTLDLSCNRIGEFEFENDTDSWPMNLENLNFEHNDMTDETLEKLRSMNWPPSLVSLKLTYNEISCVNSLSALPATVKKIEVGGSSNLLPVTLVGSRYEFFEFPQRLVSLKIECTRYSLPPDIDEEMSLPVHQRVKFPDTLENLTLNECLIRRLGWVVFPPSLKKLELKSNKISDLNTYNLVDGDKMIVHWSQLEKLQEIRLFGNDIKNLTNWLPPRSLCRLDLTYNKITSLSSKLTPIFSKKFAHLTMNLHTLKFSSNKITKIARDLHLPQHLRKLILRKNPFTKFMFTDAIADHKLLHKIDLRETPVRELTLQHPKKLYHSKLQYLFLSEEDFTMSTDDFYDVMDILGIPMMDDDDPVYRGPGLTRTERDTDRVRFANMFFNSTLARND